MRRIIIYALFSLVILSVSNRSYARELNGFSLDNTLVPSQEIFLGGPPKDAIPSIDRPEFILAKDAKFLNPTDRVLGISIGSEVKAYPIRILNWHEIINDNIADQNIVVTYCPLCGTGMVFEMPSSIQSFGVSGLLYNSDMLLYDRQTDSLWSQIKAQAISGSMKGQRLKQLMASHTTWQDWKSRYPKTLVLSTETGFVRDYTRSPYGGYEQSEQLFFSVPNEDKRYHPKEQVLGVEVNGIFKAYPFSELSRSRTPMTDNIAGQSINIFFSSEHKTGRVYIDKNHEIPTTIGFWFAWTAFHPDTEVYVAP